MTFEEIKEVFNAKGRGDSVKCKCPAHYDEKASLSISRGEHGKTVIHCHAGCTPEDVLEAVGLSFSDLSDGGFPEDKWMSYVEASKSKQLGREVRIEGVYNYTDLSGRYACTKVRLTGKEMSYGILSGDRWEWKLGDRSRSRCPSLFCKDLMKLKDAAARGERIFYAEGEKDVLTLQERGYLAVTAGGCSDWKKVFAEVFRGAEVIVCADNDAPGLKLAHEVERDLTGIAAAVTVIIPTPDLMKGDITDFFKSGKTDQDLQELIEASKANNLASQQARKLASQQASSETPDLERFHLVGKNGSVTGAFDWEIFRFLTERERILILGGVPFIYSHGVYEPDLSGARLKTMIRELIYPEFRKSNTLKRVYDLFISAAELQVKFEDLNSYPEKWICFRNGMYDPVSRELLPHDPEYRALNQIPHDFDPDAHPEGSSVESWLRFALPEEDDREMILQFCGYCLNRDVSQQKFMILNGLGGTGKSTLIKLIETVTGFENVSNIGLTALQQRFASYGLMGKLVNSCADLEVGALEDTSVLKQVLGEDSIRGEQKGKDAVSFRSYAKLIFSTNELPVIKGERTNGFYRRLLVTVMNRIPARMDPELFRRLESEIDHFIHMIVDALARMYEAGRIQESEGSRAAVTQMMEDSDSVEGWINEKMIRVPEARETRETLFNGYYVYCEINERQPVQRANFYKALRSKGFTELKSHGQRCFAGLTFPEKCPQTAPTSAPKCPIPEGFEDVTGKVPLPFEH